MKQSFLISLFTLFPLTGLAQGIVQPTSAKNDSTTTNQSRRAKAEHAKDNSGARYKVQGYRIQVFTGGNDRAAKRAAQEMKTKIQKHFPELSVYIHFQSPRWVCRVGDFISREEAQVYLKQIRKKRLSPEAAIVKSLVLRPY